MAKHKIYLCPVEGCDRKIWDRGLKNHLKFAHKISDEKKIRELKKNAIVVGEEDVVISPKKRLEMEKQKAGNDNEIKIKIPSPDIIFSENILAMLAMQGLQMGYLDMGSFIKREVIPLLYVKRDLENIIGMRISPTLLKQIIRFILNNPEILSKMMEDGREKWI